MDRALQRDYRHPEPGQQSKALKDAAFCPQSEPGPADGRRQTHLCPQLRTPAGCTRTQNMEAALPATPTARTLAAGNRSSLQPDARKTGT